MDASLKVDKKTLLQLTTKHKIEGSRSVTTIIIDAVKKPKLVEATFSSDTSLKMNELDHIFEFKSDKFYVTRLKGKSRETHVIIDFEITFFNLKAYFNIH